MLKVCKILVRVHVREKVVVAEIVALLALTYVATDCASFFHFFTLSPFRRTSHMLTCKRLIL